MDSRGRIGALGMMLTELTDALGSWRLGLEHDIEGVLFGECPDMDLQSFANWCEDLHGYMLDRREAGLNARGECLDIPVRTS